MTTAGRHLAVAPDAGRRQRLAMATIPWRFIVWLIGAAVLWDASSLLAVGNTSAYDTPSYLVLRYMPGGMRTYGIALLALLVTAVYAYGRSNASPSDLLLRSTLAAFAGWYVGWTVAILWAWVLQQHATGVGGLGRTMAFAGLCLLASWFAPHEHRG